MTWIYKPYAELSLDELYAILALRQRVFIVEQKCAYLDADDYDVRAWHLFQLAPTAYPVRVAAYARLFAPGARHAEASIGRIVTAPEVRKSGLGHALVGEAIQRCIDQFGEGPIRIGAQKHLEQFYGEHGFEVAGPEYVEDGIPHIEMLRRRAG